MKRLRLDSQARAEFLHEITYYETTRPGRGRKFRAAVDEVFARIKQNPTAGKPEEAGCRRLRVKASLSPSSFAMKHWRQWSMPSVRMLENRATGWRGRDDA